MSLITGRKIFVRASTTICLFCLSAILLQNCNEEEAHERSYPRVKTNPVSNITSKGATFSAEIYSLGSEPIIDHGFAWGQELRPSINSDNVSLGSTSSTGVYSSDILSTLEKDVEYTVVSFVKTSEHVVYGLPVKFTSLGSGAPVVTGFEPDSAAWLDTLKISGKHFSRDKARNIVKLNDVTCTVISSTDTTLKVEVSTGVALKESTVSVEIAGNNSVYTDHNFRLIMPTLDDFTPKKAYWGDTVRIKGKHLRAFVGSSSNKIYIGAVSCKFAGTFTDSIIAVKVPDDLPDISNNVSMTINGINLMAKDLFELLPPFFTFSPKSGIWGDKITLTGKFNASAKTNTFSFSYNNIDALVDNSEIVSTSATSIVLKVPVLLAQINTSIIYKTGPFKITSTDIFHLPAPVISSFSPLSGPDGTIVTIKGKYFAVTGTAVMFGSTPAYVNSISDSVIVAVVPLGLTTPEKITVTSKLQSVTSSGSFSLENPVITSFTPVTGTFNDLITINGNNLITSQFATIVHFGSLAAEIVSSSSTRLVVKVPEGMDYNPTLIFLFLGSAYASSSPVLFTLAPPEITSVSPAVMTGGSNITISGKNFDPVSSGNKVYWGLNQLQVISSTATTVIAAVPYNLPSGNEKIKVVAAGYTCSSPNTYEVKSAWTRILTPPYFEWHSTVNINGRGLAFSLNGLGYMMNHGSAQMTSFNPTDNSFNYVGAYQYLQWVDGMTSIVNNDTAYIISGSTGFYRFDVPSASPVRIGDAPSTESGGIAFSLNGKLYYGLSSGASNENFWEYRSANQTWIKKNPFPVTFKQIPVAFSINNKGYVIFSDNSFYGYDPASDQWTSLARFPGAGQEIHGRAAFAINNFGYAGSGRELYSEAAYNDFWRYDPGEGTWTQLGLIPGLGRYNSIFLVVNNKAYLGFGYAFPSGYETEQADFYEFDPGFVAK